MSIPNPPRLPRMIARLFIRGDAREVVVGDLDQEFAEAIASQVPAGAARRRYWRQAIASVLAIHRPSGDVMNVHSVSRAWHGLSLDTRSVFRALRRSPGYAAVAILSLAIGIGANTAIVSVVRQLLLAPLPVARPEELKLVYWTPPRDGKYSTRNLNSSGYTDPSGVFHRSNYTYPEFAAMRAAVGGDVPFAGYNMLRRLMITAGTRPPMLSGGIIATGAFFDVVRPPMSRGRAFNAEDDRAGAPLVAVISDKLWRTYLGAASDAVGSKILIGDAPALVVGITAEGYRGLSPGGFDVDADIAVPMASQPLVAPQWTDPPEQPLFTDLKQHWIRAIARVTPERERAVTDKLVSAFRGEAVHTDLTPGQVAVSSPVLIPAPRGTDSLRLATAKPLRLLSIVVGIVLVIACLNVAGLMLARGISRQREMDVRRALGAGRLRLIRELLVESLVLALAGGAAGVLLATWAAPALQRMLTSGLGTREVTVALDWTLLTTTFVIAATTGIAAGLIPALRLSGGGLAVNTRAHAGAPKLFIGRVLLAGQIAVSLPLVAGAGLFLQTLRNLSAVDLGFNPRQLVLFDVDPTMNGRSPERGAAIYPRLLKRLEDMPGVVSATYIENALISGFESDSTVHTDSGQKVDLFMNRVGPHFLETMGMALVAGRAIDERDGPGAPLTGVLNQKAAKIFFGNAQPIGQYIKNGSRTIQVVGVFADAKYQGLKQDVEPTMLQSYRQNTTFSQHVVVRTMLPPAEFRQQLPDVLRDVDPNLPFSQFKTQVEQINETIGKERIFSQLLTVFGAFALLLACIGLHGVTSYAVTRRTSEIGIRLALGAQRAQVLWMILRQVLVLAVAGTIIGLPGAWLAGPAVQSLLYGLAPTDAVTIAGAALVMVGVAVAAGWWPARRAARMEALAALRLE
jgi:predicted permease